MSGDNYDDWADCCGPKGFYDLDGDGHIDAFEADMMLSDIDDELTGGQGYSGCTPSHSSRKPKQGQKKSGGTASSRSSAKSKQGQKNGSHTPPSHSSKKPKQAPK